MKRNDLIKRGFRVHREAGFKTQSDWNYDIDDKLLEKWRAKFSRLFVKWARHATNGLDVKKDDPADFKDLLNRAGDAIGTHGFIEGVSYVLDCISAASNRVLISPSYRGDDEDERPCGFMVDIMPEDCGEFSLEIDIAKCLVLELGTDNAIAALEGEIAWIKSQAAKATSE